MVQAITFGPFRLLPVQRTLFENDRPLRLGSRALDLLIALADTAGELVTKDELAARVWPKTFVEDANLRVHVAALRKVLGDGLSGSPMAEVGQLAQGLAAIDEALTLSERSEGHWCLAELQRIKGELVLLEGAPQAATAAEGYFLRALDRAREQGALSWELRAATSLAHLHHRGGRTPEAHAGLAPVYARFTEGFETNDLRVAKALLDAFACDTD